MKLKPFFSDVGSTAACSIRSIIAAANTGVANRERKEAHDQERRHLVVADSWFGSVKLAETLKLLHRVPRSDGTPGYEFAIDKTKVNPNGHELIAAVKTNKGHYPRKRLEKLMEKWPGGSHLVLQTVTPETCVPLVAVAYKYNVKKVLCFIMTKNAGNTAPGLHPYIARFPDRHGNVRERKVSRPDAMATYFRHSNAIDAHNHARQYLLALERHWKTPNPWLSTGMTIAGGFTVIDAWKAVRYHCKHFQDISVEEFADRLAYDCLHNPYARTVKSPQAFIPADATATTDSLSGAASVDATGGSLLHRQQGAPGFLFGSGIEHLTERMTSLCCSTGDIGFSARSPLSSVGSQSASGGQAFTSGGFTFARSTAPPHDPIRRRFKDKTGRPSKRACCVCGMDCRSECCHPGCQQQTVQLDGEVFYGVPICSLNCKPRSHMRAFGGEENTLTCIQIHRLQCRDQGR